MEHFSAKKAENSSGNTVHHDLTAYAEDSEIGDDILGDFDGQFGGLPLHQNQDDLKELDEIVDLAQVPTNISRAKIDASTVNDWADANALDADFVHYRDTCKEDLLRTPPPASHSAHFNISANLESEWTSDAADHNRLFCRIPREPGEHGHAKSSRIDIRDLASRFERALDVSDTKREYRCSRTLQQSGLVE